MKYFKVQNLVIFSIILMSIIYIWGCSSSTGDSKPDVTPPPVPTGLNIEKIDNGSANLIWNAVSDRGLNGYNVYWLGGAEVDTLNANRRLVVTNSATISDLDYDILYYFAVTSIDQSGNESALSAQKNGRPLNTLPPSPPKGIDLVGENIDYPKITIFWAENVEPDIAYYNLYRALTSSGLDDTTSFVSNLTHENYIDIDLKIGVSYYYRVTAVDKGGWESTPSEIVSDYVLPKVTLVSPLDFSYTGVSPTFQWKSVTGAKKYKIVVTTSRIGGEIWNIEVDENTTNIMYQGKTKLISGNTYYWKIGAISRREINSISDVGTFVVRVQ